MPVQAYGFQPSPAPAGTIERLQDNQRYYEEHLTLVAEVAGVDVADASAVPMQQNVRGGVYRMARVAGVPALPQARRPGYASALATEILGLMRDQSHVVSALYPFRPSFYERFGFAGLPKTRAVTFAPSNVAGLLRTDLGGTVGWDPVKDQYDSYRAFTTQLLDRWHGFALLPESRMGEFREAGDRWLATAWVDDAVARAFAYQITGFGGDLIADDLLAATPLSKALLLQFFAQHADQVSRIVVTVPASEMPELWSTDFAASRRPRPPFPSPAPMARILSVDGLAGMPVGPGQVTLEVVQDPFIAGRYTLGWHGGRAGGAARRSLHAGGHTHGGGPVWARLWRARP